ncbi:MAG: hypothetical protein ACOWWH_11140 [Eubacteriaceae bacterium]
MNEYNKLKRTSKVVYRIKTGCVSLECSRADEYNLNMEENKYLKSACRNIKKDENVTKIICPKNKSLQYNTVSTWIHDKPTFGKELKIIQFEPIYAFMRYHLKEIDPKNPNASIKNEDIEGILLYDGFLTLWGVKKPKFSINYQRHASALNKWLENILKKGNNNRVQFSTRNPFGLNIELYIIDSSKLKETDDDYNIGELIKYHSYSNGKLIVLYLSGPDEKIDEAALDALREIYNHIRSILINYYTIKMLAGVRDHDYNKIDTLINNAGNELVQYYNLKFINIIKRYKKTQDIGKIIADIYTLMPDFERENNKIEKLRSDIKNIEYESYEIEIAKIIENICEIKKDSPFLISVREMLAHEISEIRSQVNTQFLLISAIIALGSLVITSLVSILN